MKRMSLKIFSLAVLMAVSTASFAGGGQLVELLVKESGVAELLAKQGLKGADMAARQETVKQSMVALFNKSNVSGKELLDAIKAMKTDGQLRMGKDLGNKTEAEIKASLVRLLQSNESDLKPQDISDAIDNLAVLASLRGPFNNLVKFDCARCGSKVLEQVGAKAGLKAAKANDILLPKDPSVVRAEIAGECKLSGMCDPKSAADVAGAENSRTLLRFLTLAKDKNSAEGKFAQAVKKFTKGDLFVENNQFYKVASEDNMTPELLAKWTEALEKAAVIRSKTGKNAEDSFHQALEEMSAGNPEAKELIEQLKAKRCYFGG